MKEFQSISPQTEQTSFQEGGMVAMVPLTVTIANLGGSPAGGFRIGAEIVDGNGYKAQAPFSVVGQADTWYPTVSGLQAGEMADLRGSVTIRSSGGEPLYGRSFKLTVVADTTSGQEFAPAGGSVDESNEGNNQLSIDFTLPSTALAIAKVLPLEVAIIEPKKHSDGIEQK
jgi:hypothetical protein